MKKIIILAITLIIIPQIVFAAWWNPLSWFSNWSFSNNKESKLITGEDAITQEPEKNELEEKTAASTTVEVKPQNGSLASENKTKVSSGYDVEPPKTKPVIKNESVMPQQGPTVGENSNYASVVIYFTNQKMESINKLNTLVTAYRSVVNSDIKGLQGSISSFEAYLRGYGRENRVLSWFVGEYERDVSKSKEYVNYFDKIEQDIANKISGYEANIKDLSGRNVTKEEGLVLLKTLDSDNYREDMLTKIEAGKKQYSEYREMKETGYDNAMATVRGMADSLSTPSNNYSTNNSNFNTSEFLPQWKTTRCSDDGLGGFSCFTY